MSKTHTGRTLLSVCATGLLALAVPATAHEHSGHRPPAHHHAHHHAGWHHARGWAAHGPFCEHLADQEHAGHHGHHRGLVRLFSLWFGCRVPVADPPATVPAYTQAPPPDATLLDQAGAPVADLGSLDVDDGVSQVTFATPFSDPVVILGPPTRHEADPGVAQVQGVDAAGFRVRFAEWSYLDGVHAAEAVSYLALAPGRHQMPDGSEWEVGSLDMPDAGSFYSQSFSAPFATAPELFLTIQTHNEDGPLVVRARDVTTDGFQAALFEEEGADGVHGAERVGYLALVSPPRSGRLATAAGSLPYLVRRLAADDRRVPVLSTSLWMEEETSADAEVTHPDEALSFLEIGRKVFAQDVTSADLDTAAVRRAAPEQGAVMEWGTVEGVDDGWQTVPLARSYTDPIVVVGPMSSNDADPAVLRVRNVTDDSFQIRVQEWAYLDQTHGRERVFYLVADRGVQSLGGLMVQADRVDSSLVMSEGQEAPTFAVPFPGVPGVFASVQTENDPQPVMVRIQDRTVDGFGMTMQQEDANTGSHGVETLGWIAIQAGHGTTTDGRAFDVLDTSVDSQSTSVPFGETLAGRFPSVLAHVESMLGMDSVVVRYQGLTPAPDGVNLMLQEEQSADAETKHLAEEVSVFAGE